MAINLKNRSFLKLLDFSPREIEYFLDLAAQLKKDKKTGKEQQHLKGKNIALIFEKSSTRTSRCARTPARAIGTIPTCWRWVMA